MSNSAYVFIAKMISGGRVTIPEEIRTVFGLKDGDYIELRFIRVVKKGSVPVEAPEMTGRESSNKEEVVLENG